MTEPAVAPATDQGTGTGTGKEPLSAKLKHTINCVQKPPLEHIANLKKDIDQKISNARQTAIDVVQGAVKQVQECGTGLPGVVDSIGQRIRSHISGTAQDLVDHINKVSDAFRNAPSVTDHVRFKVRSTQQMLAEMRDMSITFSKVVTSPDFKKILVEMGNNYTDGLLKTLDNLQPMIDKLTVKGDAMLKEVGDRTGQTVGNAVSNTIKAIIGEIPLVGGLITGFISIGDLSNKAIKMCEPIVQFGVDASGVANVAADKYDDLKCKWIELQKKAQPLIDKVNAAKNSVADALPSATGAGAGTGTQQTGGANTFAHLRRRIKRTQRRLQILMKQNGFIKKLTKRRKQKK